ncbi:hypothetical protein POL68_01975 [Stigmatella sp. ncwal1]|uniref:Uncharacterized protein n=1 Tax=Stigmatella ashevillensis TaxID=2995309 RepID=A0ABT5D0N5_9BACT|nr:hypothetical protein [Stigmatella ashevillena]MDC0707227.1 hypothetical protein [Stigmatella ashevillena]
MTYISDFDVEDILATLESVSQEHGADSKERGAVQLAAIALLYARHLRKLDDFRKYYREFFDPSYTVKVSREFSTQKEADDWLTSGGANDGERVKIAGKGFHIVQLSKGLRFIYAPLPEELGPPESDSD